MEIKKFSAVKVEQNDCKEKSRKNTLRKFLNWMDYSDLLPKNFNQLSRNQFMKLGTKINQVYIADDRELFLLIAWI